MRDIAPSLRSVNLDKLANLKMFWKVSMQALLYRARDMGGIPEHRASYLWVQMSKAGYRTKEPIDIPVEQPTMISEIMEVYSKELGYSTEELCQMLSIYESDFDGLRSKQSRMRLAN
jgi:Zn-dependent peptidase ImmA (M78 family)